MDGGLKKIKKSVEAVRKNKPARAGGEEGRVVLRIRVRAYES